MSNKPKAYLILGAVAVFLLLFSPHAACAAEFRTDYTVDYYLTENAGSIASQVSFRIKITNLTSDLIIKKFSLQFPKSFQIGNIKANDDFKEIVPSVTESEGKHVIDTEFSNPQAGLNSENNLYLNFLQYNLFKINGNVWEVILPTIERKDGGDYTVNVHLPAGSHKKISIAKPRPDHVTLNDIVWKNPSIRTIYAVFGDEQNYDLDLRFHLENPGLTKVYTDIAFPPDTLYQKVYVNSIQPAPANVMMDQDGNYLGRYYLNPKEDKTVYFKGGVVVSANAREDMKNVIRTLFNGQKKYMLSSTKDWTLQPKQVPASVHSVQDIYSYTMNTLSYNYGRINANITRLGASQALQYPDQAVCTEYTDVFVTLSRMNGIYAREIQGYGFSSDQNLRPLSVNSDILHSWPEFYDATLSEWHELDPTWEDTSGIDYFNSFDLNHIAFVIHGKDSDYPYPAGSYKNNDAMKDINITATAETFQDNPKMSFRVSPLQIPTLDKDSYIMKIYVQNTGNVFLWNIPLAIVADNLTFSNPVTSVASLAPYETKELSFEYVPAKFAQKARITIVSNGQPVYDETVPVTSSYFFVLKYAAVALLFVIVFILIVRFLKKVLQ